MANKNSQTAKVIDFQEETKKAGKASEKKWGKKVMKLGFCIFPSMLLKAQARLGLSAQQLAVLLQIIDHWWEPNRWPYPSKKTLAGRLSLSDKQIQRHIVELEKGGFLKRIPRYASNHKGKLSNQYDLSGLVEKLKKLEPEFTEVAKAQKAVEGKGGVKVNL